MERSVELSRAVLLGRTIQALFPGVVGTDFERYYRQVASQQLYQIQKKNKRTEEQSQTEKASRNSIRFPLSDSVPLYP